MELGALRRADAVPAEVPASFPPAPAPGLSPPPPACGRSPAVKSTSIGRGRTSSGGDVTRRATRAPPVPPCAPAVGVCAMVGLPKHQLLPSNTRSVRRSRSARGQYGPYRGETEEKERSEIEGVFNQHLRSTFSLRSTAPKLSAYFCPCGDRKYQMMRLSASKSNDADLVLRVANIIIIYYECTCAWWIIFYL